MKILFKPGDRVRHRKTQVLGTVISVEDWISFKREYDPSLPYRVFVEHDSTICGLYFHSYGGDTAVDIIELISTTKKDAGCNHKYILMLNNYICEYCGEPQ